MRAIELEAWVLRVADTIKAGGHNEDSRVELKAKWPDDPARAARRIAGLANAGRGDDVLWLIGLDETEGVVGATASDTASWWGSVKAWFDEGGPSLQDQVVHLDGQSVVALLFGAEGAPFVVRNPAHGQSGGGPVEREVPWRDGTSTRTARRSDLVRLLVPRLREPEFEVLAARVSLYEQDRPLYTACDAYVTVYSHGEHGASLTIPDHRLSMVFRVEDCELTLTAHTSGQNSGGDRTPFGPRKPVVTTVHSGASQVLIEGPGPFSFVGNKRIDGKTRDSFPSDCPATLTIEWTAVGAEAPRRLQIDLPWAEPTQVYRAGWRVGDDR